MVNVGQKLREQIKEYSQEKGWDKDTEQRAYALALQDEFREEINKTVIGQDVPKGIAAMLIYQIHARAFGNTYVEDAKSNVLFIGPPGSGKTLLAQEIARLSDVPYMEFGLADVSSTGYVGASLSDAYDAYAKKVIGYQRAKEKEIKDKINDHGLFNKNKEKRFGIMFLDEVDKLATYNDFDGKKGFGTKVQNELLTHLQGTNVPIQISQNVSHRRQTDAEINTKDMTFICAGAFSGLEGIIAKRLGVAKNTPLKELYDKLMPRDLIDYGMQPQFLGRFDQIVTFDELKREELIDILRTRKSPIDIKRKMLKRHYGTNLQLHEDVYGYIADLTLKYKEFGARALKQLTNDLFNPLITNLGHHLEEDELHITLDMAKDLLAKHDNRGPNERPSAGFNAAI